MVDKIDHGIFLSSLTLSGEDTDLQAGKKIP